VQLETREKVISKREAQVSDESGRDDEQLSVRARELDQRELELSARASELTARMEDLERQAAERDAVATDALAKLDNIEQRETELFAREAELHRLEASARRAAEEARTPEVDELAERRLKQRDDELSAREAALNKAEQAILASRSRYGARKRTHDEERRFSPAAPKSWRSVPHSPARGTMEPAGGHGQRLEQPAGRGRLGGPARAKATTRTSRSCGTLRPPVNGGRNSSARTPGNSLLRDRVATSQNPRHGADIERQPARRPLPVR
jgi:hypothetical protein